MTKPTTGRQPQGSGPSPHPDALTPRQLVILRWLADGWTPQEIADELDLTAKAMAVAVRQLLMKVGARNATHAVAVGYQQGLLSVRAVQPCGTVAAYKRHQRRGEPIDAACQRANTESCRPRQRAARSRRSAVVPGIEEREEAA